MTIEELTIIIPALNEELSIADMIQKLRAKFSGAEILVIDDGSTDRTGEDALRAGAKVIRREKTMGYGAALSTGVQHTERPYVLFCDADGQHSVDDVEKLIAAADDVDMVIGARTTASHVQSSRRPGKWILKHFANFLAGCDIPDINSGLRLIKREIIQKYLHLMPAGFSFSTTSTFAILKSNHTIKWVPITVLERKGQSTVRQFRHGPQTMMLMLRLTVLFEPLKVFLSVDAVLLVLTVGLFIKDLMTRPWIGLGASTVILFITTLMVFLFGLVCDQVAAIRREMHE